MAYNDLSTVKKINGIPVDLNYFSKVTENDAFFKNVADNDEDLAFLNQDILPISNNAYSLGAVGAAFTNGYITNLISSALSLSSGSLGSPALKIANTGLASLAANELSFILSSLEVLKLNSAGMTLKAANNSALKIQNILPGAEALWLLGANQDGFSLVDASVSQVLKAQFGPNSTALFTKLLVPNGTELAPSLSFNDDPSTGIYKDPSGPILFFGTSGSNKLTLSSAALEVLSDKLIIPDGTLTAPSFTFTGSQNSGLSCLSDVLKVVIQNRPILSINGDGSKMLSESDLMQEVCLYAENNFPRQVVRRSKGTESLPVALGAATDVYAQTFESYTDTGFMPVAEVAVFTQDDHSAGTYGTAMLLSTVRQGETEMSGRIALSTQGLAGVHIADSLGLNTSILQTAGTHTINVKNVSKLMIDATAGNIIIEGFAGGQQGQMLYIYKKAPTNTFTLNFNSGTAPQKVLLKGSVNYVNTNDYGGITLAFDEGVWREVSRS